MSKPSGILNILQSEIDSTLTGWVLGATNWLGWSAIANHIVRPGILRLFGLGIGPKCCVFPGLRIYSRRDRIRVGEKTFLNQNCFLDAAAPITIGDYCQVGFNVSFATSSHQLDTDFQSLRANLAAPIVVEDYVWIGCNVTILGGTRIGRGSVIAAGAVVNKDVPPNTVVGGIPSKVIRQINNAEVIRETVQSTEEPEEVMAS